MKSGLLCVTLLLIIPLHAFGQRTKTSDPCAGAQSQAEMNICAGKKFQDADAVLNQVFKRLVAMLDDEQKLQLRDVENSWLKYRDANCDFVADEYKGGSMRPMIHALCLEEMTRNRTTELRNQIKERSN
jgi:uncharacterized protein YecT (DUF1311 family)